MFYWGKARTVKPGKCWYVWCVFLFICVWILGRIGEWNLLFYWNLLKQVSLVLPVLLIKLNFLASSDILRSRKACHRNQLVCPLCQINFYLVMFVHFRTVKNSSLCVGPFLSTVWLPKYLLLCAFCCGGWHPSFWSQVKSMDATMSAAGDHQLRAENWRVYRQSLFEHLTDGRSSAGRVWCDTLPSTFLIAFFFRLS